MNKLIRPQPATRSMRFSLFGPDSPHLGRIKFKRRLIASWDKSLAPITCFSTPSPTSKVSYKKILMTFIRKRLFDMAIHTMISMPRIRSLSPSLNYFARCEARTGASTYLGRGKTASKDRLTSGCFGMATPTRNTDLNTEELGRGFLNCVTAGRTDE